MENTFDAFDYLRHLRGKWRVFAVVCGVALVAAAAAALLLPRKYTATTRMIIEPPGGSDPRMSVAVSPIYLESLKTYEIFALSDNLFQRALDHFGLRRQAENRPFESWKRSVLKVQIPRNTKILEINATLTDPKVAHALALYLAQETAALSRAVNHDIDRELRQDAESQAAAARARLDRVTADYRRAASGLRRDPVSAEDRRAILRRRLSSAEPGAERQSIERKLAELEQHSGDRSADSEILFSSRLQAEIDLEAAEKHLREVRAMSGTRSEQLNVIDPGIVPERPSSPDVSLILIAALLLALTASLVYVTLEFGFERQRLRSARPPLRMAARDV